MENNLILTQHLQPTVKRIITSSLIFGLIVLSAGYLLRVPKGTTDFTNFVKASTLIYVEAPLQIAGFSPKQLEDHQTLAIPVTALIYALLFALARAVLAWQKRRTTASFRDISLCKRAIIATIKFAVIVVAAQFIIMGLLLLTGLIFVIHAESIYWILLIYQPSDYMEVGRPGFTLLALGFNTLVCATVFAPIYYFFNRRKKHT